MHVTMRESWTDERLDDFRAEVNRRFDEVDRRFGAVDRRFDRIEGEVQCLRAEMKVGFERMYRLLIGVGGSFIATLIVSAFTAHL